MKNLKICFFTVIFLCVTPVGAFAQTYWIAAFGDSLTEGYNVDKKDAFPVQLADFLYEDGYDIGVINAGKTGNTTRDALVRFQDTLKKMPDVMIIQFGVNDVIKGLPIEETEKNLSRMVAAAKKNDVAVLLAGINVPRVSVHINPADYTAMYRRIAKKYNVPLYPNFTAGVADYSTLKFNKHLLGSDEMHPNVDGIGVIAEGVLPYVKEILNALDVRYSSGK